MGQRKPQNLARLEFFGRNELRAAEIANGKNNPLPYINAVLSGWKNDGVYSVDKIPVQKTAASKSGAFKSREYTQAELDSLIDDIDDVEF